MQEQVKQEPESAEDRLQRIESKLNLVRSNDAATTGMLYRFVNDTKAELTSLKGEMVSIKKLLEEVKRGVDTKRT